MAAVNFNANEVDPSKSFDPLPAGKYNALITNSEEKPTKAGTGSYLELTFEVLDEAYKGRRLWARLNLNNPSDQAVAIARAELSAICHAVNVLELQDTAQLHDLPMTVKVVAKPDKMTGEVRNEIKGYEATGPNVTSASATVANKAAPVKQQPATAGKNPFKR